MNVQPVRVGLPEVLNIPPPELSAVLFVNVQSVRVGLLVSSLYIPPPAMSAELFVNVQSVRAGLLLKLLYIPPPTEYWEPKTSSSCP